MQSLSWNSITALNYQMNKRWQRIVDSNHSIYGGEIFKSYGEEALGQDIPVNFNIFWDHDFRIMDEHLYDATLLAEDTIFSGLHFVVLPKTLFHTI